MLKNINNSVIKDVSISFIELLKLKEKLDTMQKAYEKANEEFPGANRTIMLQDNNYSAYMTFFMAGRLYYNNEDLDFETLLQMFEEESIYYKESAKKYNKKSSNFTYTINPVRIYDDLEDNPYDELDEEDYVLSIKKGN